MMQEIVWRRQKHLLRKFTGLTWDEFHCLLPAFTHAYQQAEDLRRAKAHCVRRAGGGRKSWIATPAEKLLFILVYVRLYPPQEVQAYLFGMTQSEANPWILRLLPVLQAALGAVDALPARPGATAEDLLAHMPDLKEFLVDGTERPIQRPQEATRQEACYSGKKNAIRSRISC
jgi:hypothetical protein